MSDEKQGPWSRLIAAARNAQTVLQALRAKLATSDWGQDEAMQAFEDVECALMDVKETKLNADELPALVEACRAGVKDYETFMDGKETYPEYHHAAIGRISRALAKAATDKP